MAALVVSRVPLVFHESTRRKTHAQPGLIQTIKVSASCFKMNSDILCCEPTVAHTVQLELRPHLVEGSVCAMCDRSVVAVHCTYTHTHTSSRVGRLSFTTAGRRIRAMTEVLHFFVLREWTFPCDNIRRLRRRLTARDRRIYHLDVAEVQ